ncbi:14163_t:CDS:2 [Funneliformis mosseae]|uniref:DASH complex subunit DAM1 n=1 Tax=Funneliformis mosseae TaxID=27381 RepID=A0A9N8VFB2_FUNMO|nr:14163_t:CDS:2 [Funneliformis mosseae]
MNFSLSVRAEQQNRRLSRGYTLKNNNISTGLLGVSSSNDSFILDCFETPLIELEKSFNSLLENFENIKKVQESLNEFNKAFSGFLYGIKMNAHCVEFSEAPTKEAITSFINRRVSLQTKNTTPRMKTPTHQLQSNKKVEEQKNLETSTKSQKSQVAILVTKNFKTPTKVLQKPRRRKINKQMEIKAVIKRIVDTLPQKYREKQQANRGNVEAILKLVCSKPNDGLYMEEIIKRTNLTRFRCWEYLNILVNGNHVIKISKKGQMFKLDPIKYANFIHLMSL